MLTRFFGKSKPINFIVVVVFMTVFFIIANFQDWFGHFELLNFSEKFVVLLAFLISAGVLNFIAKKNELTRRSAYKILLFAVFSTSFFTLLQNHQVIFANLFVLLALRRIISLKSRKEIEKKIFDATFWVCIASLFYFWAILFLIVVYAGVLVYASNARNWLITPVSFFSVAILTTCFHLLAYDQFYTFSQWYQESQFDFSNYQNPRLLIPLSIILTVLLWTLVFYIGLLQKASITSRPSYNLVVLSLFTAMAVAVFSPHKNGSEFIFFFIPLSIIASNYFESKRDRTFREVLLILLVIMPLSLPLLF